MLDTIRNIGRNTITVSDLREVDHTTGNDLFVDVREGWEWDAGHIDFFVHIPLSTVEEHLEEFRKYERIFFICRSGGRSGAACDMLKASSNVSAHNILGGMTAWSEAGFKTTSSLLTHYPKEEESEQRKGEDTESNRY
jgi:rhodanese-related sulfurtransferase